MARYLDGRIQVTFEQKKGRVPDMSPVAAAAMKAVLIEVGSDEWEPLKLLVKDGGAALDVPGVGAQHSRDARDEAARRIIGNHFLLLKDVCNPSSLFNVHGVPLTQPELTRVKHALAPQVT